MVATNVGSQSLGASQTPHQIAELPERMDQQLLQIIRDNLNTQYATQAVSLGEFRDAVLTHGTENDTNLLADFRAHVPLSKYDSYKPFIDKFKARPCKEEDVVDLLSPGLPEFLLLSSATTGTTPKILPMYNHNARLGLTIRRPFDPDGQDPLAGMVYTGYRDVAMVERAPGEVVQRVPVCYGTGANFCRSLGLHIDDDSRMSLSMSGYAVPWAATVIAHFPSFLTIHGLFFLAKKNVHRFRTTFITHFVDLIHCINEHWDLLVSCIRDGKVPDLEGTDHVREYLQPHLHPNPERAAELLEIGPPFSSEGWFSRVWPKANVLLTVCSGPFATVLPKAKSILGPDVSIRCSGYAASEGVMGFPHNVSKLDEFVLFQKHHIVEFLDISLDAVRENLCQSWEVEVGKDYEPILTTRNGLWRYQLGDVLHIIGFHPEHKLPLFKYVGRRTLSVRLPSSTRWIRDDQLLAAIQVLNSEDAIRVQEFTTLIDDRTLLSTIGFFIELAGPLGSNANLAPQKLFDALVAGDSELQFALEYGKMRLPSVRIVKAGTFAEYRHWRSEKANISFGQIKVPVILLDPTAQEWILGRVVQEL